jgi:alpha-beta hydrolase superfamily lysophospholipase
MGKGVKRVASMLKKAGAENITVRLFSGNRHELLNDKDRAGAIEELCRFMSAGI